MSDSDLIYREVLAAQRDGREISDACARMIASQWHAGQASDGYAFASTGAISTGPDLWRELFAADYESMTAADKTAADMFGTYLTQHAREHGSSRGPVPGWSGLWLSEEPARGCRETDGDRYCTLDAGHDRGPMATLHEQHGTPWEAAPRAVSVSGPTGVAWDGELVADHGNGISRVRVTGPGTSWHRPGDVLDVGTRTLSDRELEPEAGELAARAEAVADLRARRDARGSADPLTRLREYVAARPDEWIAEVPAEPEAGE